MDTNRVALIDRGAGGLGLKLFIVFFGLCALSQAGIEQDRSAQTMLGMRQTGGSLVGVTAGGQCLSGINRDHVGGLQNYAGFLTSLSFCPNLDHDQDGLSDEIDPDNDNDGIEDAAEIIGSQFVPAQATDPNNPDTDGDGLSDFSEWTANTDPTNQASVMAITSISLVAGKIQVSWTGGRLARQIISRRANLADISESWHPIMTNSPPTLTTMSLVDPGGTNSTYFYRVEASLP